MSKMNPQVYFDRRLCPVFLGARTAGELQKEIRKRIQRRFSLVDCYFLLCGRPCSSRPCCRPDYDKGGRR
jgi:hypothetical protein